jgi:hypothetical protein
MKRIIFVTCLMLLLAGCNVSYTNSVRTYSKPVIVLPDEDTAYNINGYKDTTQKKSSENNNQNDNEDCKVYGNKSTKKVHNSDCRYAKNMKQENLVVFDNIEDALISGYFQCSVCAE